MESDSSIYNLQHTCNFFSTRAIKQLMLRCRTYLLEPKCDDIVLNKIKSRLDLEGILISKCRCGTCSIESTCAPRIVSVCHCSVCRFAEAKAVGNENAPAPCFAAVKRSSCHLIINSGALGSDTDASKSVFEFQESSYFARRGYCSLCRTYILMDYEWFEPSTLWLQNPVWHSAGAPEKCPTNVELMYNDGRADFDMCWSSRYTPCSGDVCLQYFYEDLEEKNEKYVDTDDVKPRGLLQFEGLDSSAFYYDVGSL